DGRLHEAPLCPAESPRAPTDDNEGSAETSAMHLPWLPFGCRIFGSSVEGGIPNLTAAPSVSPGAPTHSPAVRPGPLCVARGAEDRKPQIHRRGELERFHRTSAADSPNTVRREAFGERTGPPHKKRRA